MHPTHRHNRVRKAILDHLQTQPLAARPYANEPHIVHVSGDLDLDDLTTAITNVVGTIPVDVCFTDTAAGRIRWVFEDGVWRKSE